MDDPDDLLRDIGHAVVGHEPKVALCPATLRRKDVEPLPNTLHLQTDHHDDRLLHRLRTLVRLAEVERRKIQDRRFLGDGPRIGQHRAR